jgi:hypothetical protein
VSDENPPQTLLTALLEVQKEIPALKLGKDASGQVAGNRNYKYLTLEKLMDAVLPLLNKHGLVWVTRPSFNRLGDDRMAPILEYELVHRNAGSQIAPSERVLGSMPLMLDKPTSQQLGSAITYARRYSLCAVLGIVADEDDDGAKASEAPTRLLKAKDDDRPLTAEEFGAMREAIKRAGANEALLFTAAGVEDEVRLSHAREIKRRLEA